MKKLVFIATVFMLFVFASCDPTGYDKNDDSEIKKSNISAVDKDKLLIPEEPEGGDE